VVDDLDAWAAEARAQEAALARSRTRWLRQQADDGADFTSVLVELSERGTDVAIDTARGGVVRGRITTVGRDFVAVAGQRARVMFVASVAVVAVRPLEQTGSTLSVDRRHPVDDTLAAAVTRAAADRPRVVVHTSGASAPLAGELRSCGRDVMTVVADGEPPAPAYLRLSSVSEISFDSG
jgi:hypothetical protein